MPRLPSAPQCRRLVVCAALLCMEHVVFATSSQISDLKSKISGVEELLEEFRKQLQQDQEHKREDGVGDGCLSSFNAIEDYIIRAKDSIESGATFLTAPSPVHSWKDCLHACCASPHCTVTVVQKDRERAEESLSCFLFNCTYRNRNVCQFSLQKGYSSYNRVSNATLYPSLGGANLDLTKEASYRKASRVKIAPEDSAIQDIDEPPRSDAGQDVVLQLPTDWAVLDGRDSVDDHGITRYEWSLLQGDPSVNMKVTQPGVLKLSGLQEGTYLFQMTVTDTDGQKSSDNVTVTVIAPEHQAEVCTGHCSRYQFMCDDGCCIDITYACDGKQQCPDRSDEAFCQSFDGSRKAVTHSSGVPSQLRIEAHTEDGEDRVMLLGEAKKTMVELKTPIHSYDRGESLPLPHGQTEGGRHISDNCLAPPAVGPCKGLFPRWYFDEAAGICKHFIYGGCKGNGNNFLQETDCINECIRKQGTAMPKNITDPSSTTRSESPNTARAETAEDQGEGDPLSKPHHATGGHPVPESGAVLPLALGLAITALLLLMVACRLRLVRQKLKKARPITSEESDYLINGMYL
ncbi:low-density lipoprotein receptor-related protein 11 isoform X2 [Amia ocellicauda]|uniref:low-density lipoprotein receptor-related protein 11 isoform X2 n=1 Tax=Amia ocellicauda TaxID=2972642 RepID=UPI003463EBD3